MSSMDLSADEVKIDAQKVVPVGLATVLASGGLGRGLGPRQPRMSQLAELISKMRSERVGSSPIAGTCARFEIRFIDRAIDLAVAAQLWQRAFDEATPAALS